MLMHEDLCKQHKSKIGSSALRHHVICGIPQKAFPIPI